MYPRFCKRRGTLFILKLSLLAVEVLFPRRLDRILRHCMIAKGICRGDSVFIALSTYSSKLRINFCIFIIVIDPIRSIDIFGVWCFILHSLCLVFYILYPSNIY